MVNWLNILLTCTAHCIDDTNKIINEHWLESIDKSRVVFEEAGVEFLELERELERA